MPRSRELVTADALIQIAKDPNRYAELLDEFSVRQQLAVVAEGKAKTALTALAAAQKKADDADGQRAARDRALIGRENAVSGKEADVRKREGANVAAERLVKGREDVVTTREKKLSAERNAALESVKALLAGAA